MAGGRPRRASDAMDGHRPPRRPRDGATRGEAARSSRRGPRACESAAQRYVALLVGVLPVREMDRALHFYTEVLGFTKTFENGSPVGFAILKRDAAEPHLTLARDHAATARNLAHLLVSDARALHDALAAHDTSGAQSKEAVQPERASHRLLSSASS
jgi:hypothetical protein